MRIWKLATGGLLLAGLVVFLLGSGATTASPPKTTSTGKASSRAAKPQAGKPTAKQKTQTQPSAKEPSDATKAAALLRTKGKIISQSGDLKLKVESNFFTEFPGFSLDSLSAPQRDDLLKHANSVYCTCGCRGDTVARCVALDPTCQTARRMFQKMLDDITAGDQPAAGQSKPASR